MQFGFLGIDYKNADLAVRDEISFTDQKKMEFFRKAEENGIEQVMILSTCNRSEIYYFYEKESQVKAIQDIYCDMFEKVQIRQYIRHCEEDKAVSYLFRVTAGLESMVLGEDQILGQVKDALDFSRTMGFSKKELNKVVRDAVTCAKKVKTTFKMSEKPVSVGYIGILEVEKTCMIKGKTILVIGSGDTAVLALRYLYEYEAGKIYLCSRTLAHAGNVQKEFQEIEIISYEQRYEIMKQCDIVVSATSAPHVVVKEECFTPEKSVTFLDLATPRDIDPKLSDEPKVNLINLDTIKEISKANQSEREELCRESFTMIEKEKEETIKWLFQVPMEETIRSLQEKCTEIVEDSYSYLSRKMDLGTREQKLLKKVLNASLQRMIKEPIQELKHLETRKEQADYKKMVEQLFGIDTKKGTDL